MMPATLRALSELTDEGVFERLATAVLREADPLCASVCHLGITLDGKTKKAPLDGVAIVREGELQRLVAIHHTTTALGSLKAKWLYEPEDASAAPKPESKKNKSKRRSQPKYPRPPGDLIKTATIVGEVRQRLPDLKATLVLTTNQEPDSNLLSAVKLAGAARGIDVDVWSRSRIAHVLDTNRVGQWIRRCVLRIEAELLSADLLAELSRLSLESFAPPDDASAWVHRRLDETLRGLCRPVTFLVADPGIGKTVAAHRALRAHVEGGGFALVLPHELIENSISLEGALTQAFVQLHPKLAVGQSPLELCSSHRRLLVVVEDVNRSREPQRLLEKLARWAKTLEGQPAIADAIRLICPVWRQTTQTVDEQTRRVLEPSLVVAEPMTSDEAQRAVVSRCVAKGRTVSDYTASQVAAALGNDPLLIALHDYEVDPNPPQVIGRFVERCLHRVTSETNSPDTLSRALNSLAEQMLRNRNLNPSWASTLGWLGADTLASIGLICRAEEILRLSGQLSERRILFRHDRVRNFLLTEAALNLEFNNQLAEELLADPYYADIFGAAVLRLEAPAAFISRLKQLNPLALFHALRLSVPGASLRPMLLHAISEWLDGPTSRGLANASLRWQALVELEFTEGHEVPDLIRRFSEQTGHAAAAALRNGDVDGGIELCARYNFGIWATFRDRQIEHARLHFGSEFVRGLSERLASTELTPRMRIGAVRLAGHLSEPSLTDSLEKSWAIDGKTEDHLGDYLWAFARCCDDDAVATRNLEPICDRWASLPDKPKEGEHSAPRNSFAAYDLKMGLARYLPTGEALKFFVARARGRDLAWPLTQMLNGIDHPIAVEWVAEYAAQRMRDSAGSYLVGDFIREWDRREENARPMSDLSRAVLLNRWQDLGKDTADRRVAFLLWCSRQGASDAPILRAWCQDEVLGTDILIERASRGDRETIPALIARIRDEHGERWWRHTRHVWSPELFGELERVLMERPEHIQGDVNEDWELCEVIARLSVPDAERLLLRHWDRLRHSRKFVQLALYTATDKTCRLARERLATTPEPAQLLGGLHHTFGIQYSDHPGVTRESQILALEPCLSWLDEMEVASLAGVCNKRGWFAMRRHLLDPLLVSKEIQRVHAWSVAMAEDEFDEMVKRSHWVAHDVEQILKTGIAWRDVRDAMVSWVKKKGTLKALLLLSKSLVANGSRDDIDVMPQLEAVNQKAVQALICDTAFAVRRRTLA